LEDNMNAFRAVTIQADGSATAHTWDTSQDTLTRLQAEVGGFVDVVSLASNLDMWVNDAGLLEGLPINTIATAIAAGHGKTHQPYVGPAVFTGGADHDGATLALTEAQVGSLLTIARNATM
jgi:hypothetical protein